MLGIIVGLALSWVLLAWLVKGDLRDLGLASPVKGLKQLSIGFLVTAILCVAVQYLESWLSDADWVLNDDISPKDLAARAWWDLRSVFTEELIFRGALLLILIRKIGTQKAVFVSAIAFGVYHWFSFGIIGNLVPMIVIFIGTGLMGYAWALAFAKTKSMAMPTGLHFGWNVTLNTVFSRGPLASGLLIPVGGNPLSDFFSLVGLWLVPAIVLLFVMKGVKSEPAPESLPSNQPKI